jgi:hypothetical protein
MIHRFTLAKIRRRLKNIGRPQSRNSKSPLISRRTVSSLILKIGELWSLIVAFRPLTRYPKAQEVRYAANKKAFEEILFPRSWQDDFYERVIYNITLKTLYELFQSDSANALETVVLNGFVRAIDRAIGHEVKAYIISVQAMKQEFLAINLSQVDPKACVRRLNGSASERMSELVPIEPPASR